MTMLTRLQPSRLWTFFAQICQIPHPSKQEAALSNWITNLASAKKLDFEKDSKGNLLIRKNATEGLEHLQPVVLQAHLDMVPQANEETIHNFNKDPIQPYIDGNWVRAKGTTLGADNGIGAAACLAILTDPAVKHGPLEVLFTIDEEAGMGGAFGLEPDWFQGKLLINTDAEQDGDIYMGCAGGLEAKLEFPLEVEPLPAGFMVCRLQLKRLQGGHSGLDIHEDRGNANLLLSRTLARLQAQLTIRIASLNGGSLRNAIPREAEAVVAIPSAQYSDLLSLIEQEGALLQREYKYTDPEIELTCTHTATSAVTSVLKQAIQKKWLAGLLAIPNGVIRMSHAVKGIVETSSNLGILQQDKNKLTAIAFIRSLTDEGRWHLRTLFSAVAECAQADVIFSGDYSGWEPDPQSILAQLAQQQHQRLFGTKANIMVIHAGLECGLFKKRYPELDMISIGPTIKGAHSPDERVLIPSVERFWQLLTSTLAAIPSQETA